MDPISLIITALVQGAAKAATEVVPDAYHGLQQLLGQRFAGNPTAEMVLEEYTAHPQTDEAPLRHQLEQLGVSVAAPSIEIGRGAKGIIGQTVINATITGDIH